MAKEIKRGGAGERKSENGSNPYFNLDAEKAFFDEVDEEVRNEKFKELVNKYGGFILAVVIAGLAFAVGYEKVGEWRVSQAEQSNIRYVQAVTPGTDYENNIAELESIVNTESGLYKDIARLQIANILLDNNQTTTKINSTNNQPHHLPLLHVSIVSFYSTSTSQSYFRITATQTLV